MSSLTGSGSGRVPLRILVDILPEAAVIIFLGLTWI